MSGGPSAIEFAAAPRFKFVFWCRSTTMALNGNWHPASLSKVPGSDYSSTYVAMKARHAAMAMLGIAFELYTGSRPAETLRWKFTDTRIATSDGTELPVWYLGLAGVLKNYQQALGTGFEMRSYHCKYLMESGQWDPVDILPPTMSGAHQTHLPLQ